MRFQNFAAVVIWTLLPALLMGQEESSSELEIKMFSLKFAEPENVERVIRDLFEDEIRTSHDARTQTVLVRGPANELALIEAVVSKLDSEVADRRTRRETSGSEQVQQRVDFIRRLRESSGNRNSNAAPSRPTTQRPGTPRSNRNRSNSPRSNSQSSTSQNSNSQSAQGGRRRGEGEANEDGARRTSRTPSKLKADVERQRKVAAAYLKKLDRDKDGVLTGDEVKKLHPAYRLTDRNEDDKVTLEELVVEFLRQAEAKN